MTARRRGAGAKVLGGALALLVLGAGCSVIVSGDVPDVACDPAGGAAACPTGLVCDDATRRCVADGGVIPVEEAGDPDVAVADASDARLEADAPSGPLDLGSKCRVDGDCKSKLCASATVLTTAIVSGTGPICTTPCCTSSQCASGFVCFNGGTGGNYCVPGALAGRGSAQGPATGGATCMVDRDCRSGVCSGTTTRTCLDTCCTEGDCGGTTTCRVIDNASTPTAPPPVHSIWACAPPETAGASPAGAACTSNATCASDTCIPSGSGNCRPSCSNTASCRALGGFFTTGHCLYLTSGTDQLKFCSGSTFTSRKQAGLPCSAPTDCQSDYCDAELKTCANVCAVDADCAATEACRPSAVNTPFLRCVTKPL
ncbi:MAG: hypothetical protein JWP97_4996 [Labilithrix sp.]|nr:hypothetical protein [Labilithrix sp.]